MLSRCTTVNHIPALNSPGFYLEVYSNSAISDLTIEFSVASITLISPVIYRKGSPQLTKHDRGYLTCRTTTIQVSLLYP